MADALAVGGDVYTITVMPRGGSSIQRGGIYHIISRFVAKDWFIESAVERQAYLTLLGLAIAQTDWRLFCYAIMSSHIHLGLVAGTDRLRDWMRPMHSAFATWINVRRERIGAVFVRGPNVIAVEPHGAARLINYIHGNPVRANVVAQPSDSDWTSHRAYLGRARRPTWLQIECGLELSGFATPEAFGAWADVTWTASDDLDAVSGSCLRALRGRPSRGLRGAKAGTPPEQRRVSGS